MDIVLLLSPEKLEIFVEAVLELDWENTFLLLLDDIEDGLKMLPIFLIRLE